MHILRKNALLYRLSPVRFTGFGLRAFAFGMLFRHSWPSLFRPQHMTLPPVIQVWYSPETIDVAKTPAARGRNRILFKESLGVWHHRCTKARHREKRLEATCVYIRDVKRSRGIGHEKERWVVWVKSQWEMDDKYVGKQKHT
jgi:hypothetical protein